MDGSRFDALTRAVTTIQKTSRRQNLKLLAGGVLGVLAVPFWVSGASAVCRSNGIRCTAGAECCSGVCKKKAGTRKKFCRAAPGQGTCTIEQDICRGMGSGICNGNAQCECHLRSNGASVCTGKGACATCATDGDCSSFGQGWLCVRCAFCGPEGNRGCVPPCPTTP